MNAELVPERAIYRPPPAAAERPCPECLVDLMRERHAVLCSRAPRIDTVLRLAVTPAERRLEELLATCHRRGVRAWIRSGRAL